jgi:hypothetical protein
MQNSVSELLANSNTAFSRMIVFSLIYIPKPLAKDDSINLRYLIE